MRIKSIKSYLRLTDFPKKYRTRQYAVSCVLLSKRIDAYQTGKQLLAKISVDDTSVLNDSTENIITLVTCVKNQPDYRWCVQARQK